MRLNKHQSISITVIFILAMSFIGVVLGSVFITALANSESSPWYISLNGMQRTPTAFQPNSFANILEDGSIELIPRDVHPNTRSFDPARIARKPGEHFNVGGR